MVSRERTVLRRWQQVAVTVSSPEGGSWRGPSSFPGSCGVSASVCRVAKGHQPAALRRVPFLPHGLGGQEPWNQGSLESVSLPCPASRSRLHFFARGLFLRPRRPRHGVSQPLRALPRPLLPLSRLCLCAPPLLLPPLTITATRLGPLRQSGQVFQLNLPLALSGDRGRTWASLGDIILPPHQGSGMVPRPAAAGPGTLEEMLPAALLVARSWVKFCPCDLLPPRRRRQQGPSMF